MELILNTAELAALFRQEPSTKGDGGWQNLLVGLQEACDRPTGKIIISFSQRRRIRKYAFDYGKGGWEDRLTSIFGCHLGAKLDLGL